MSPSRFETDNLLVKMRLSGQKIIVKIIGKTVKNELLPFWNHFWTDVNNSLTYVEHIFSTGGREFSTSGKKLSIKEDNFLTGGNKISIVVN